MLILLLENDHIYQAYDGNYYTGPRQDIVRPVQRPPNFLEWIVDGKITYSILIILNLAEVFNTKLSYRNSYKQCDIGIKSLVQIPGRIRRQGFIGLQAVLGQGGLAGVLPIGLAGALTAGVFRNEIAEVIEEYVGNVLPNNTVLTVF